MKKYKSVPIEGSVEKIKDGDKVYYHINVLLGDKQVEVKPVFFTSPKQRGLIKHLCARLIGDEHAVKQKNKK